jgi:hypothetical protein
VLCVEVSYLKSEAKIGARSRILFPSPGPASVRPEAPLSPSIASYQCFGVAYLLSSSVMQQQEEEEATIRETKSLMSGRLETTEGDNDDFDVDDEGLHGSTGAEEEGIEQPFDDAQGLSSVTATEATKNGDVDKEVNNGTSKSAKKIVRKSSSLLADATHISMPLYRHPRQRQRWGDTQVHPVKEWGTHVCVRDRSAAPGGSVKYRVVV